MNHESRIKHITAAIALFVIGFLLLPGVAHAATITISTPSSALYLGDEFVVLIHVDAPKAINAVGIALTYPADIVDAEQVLTGDSIIRIWTREPQINKQKGEVTLTGGLPTPGFTGEKGLVAAVHFKVKAIAPFSFTVKQGSSILLNDGLGTHDALSFNPLLLESRRPAPGQTQTKIPTAPDTTPPANLMLDIGHDSGLFGDKYFAAFGATDNVGIHEYELAEVLNQRDETYPHTSAWYPATSPHTLKHQTGKVRVFLKAIDTSGNQAIISSLIDLDAHRKASRYSTALYLTLFVLLLVCISIFIRRYYIRKKILLSVQR